MNFTNTRTNLVLIFFLVFTGNIFSQVPVADFIVNDKDGCAPFINATFTSTSTENPTSFTWDFGDGGSPITVNNPVVQHNYALPGVYSVSLIATNAIGSSAPEIKINFITVFQNPKAKYIADNDTICSGGQFNFTDTSIPGNAPISLYSWSYQDGSPPETGPGLSNVFHSYINLGTQLTSYTPLLLVSDTNGCSNSFDSLTIFIKPEATANFGLGPGSTCSIPATIVFTNSSTGPSIFSWNFGDPTSGGNNTSTNATPSHDYNAGGSYLVTLINGFPGCTAEDTMTISVAPLVAEFTMSDSIVCRWEPVSFTNTSTPTPLSSLTFQWTFGDLTAFNTATNPVHAYINPDIYSVLLVTRLGGCIDSVTHTITVPNPPSISFSASDRIACETPFSVSFFADTSSLNVGWQWNFGDPISGVLNSSTLRDPIHSYDNFGSYPVTLIVTDIYGCSDTVSIFNYIQIIQPTIAFTVQDSGCVGSTFNYNATVISPADSSIITDYTWDFGDGSPTQSGSNPGTTHQFNTVGIFDVTLTITTQSGCTATLTKQGYARVGTTPNAQIDSVVSSICFKGTVSFNDLTPAPVTGWLWYFGDNQSSTDQNPNHKYEFDTSGVADPFDIILIAYYNGCADSDTVVNMVTVLPPIPLFDTTMNCINPDSVVFTNLSGGADSLFWNFGDGSPIDSLSTNPYHIYSRGDYYVVLTAKNTTTGCIVDTTLLVSVREINALALSDVTEVCDPGTINFTGSGSQDAVAWEWTFGEGIPNVLDTSIVADTPHLYTRPGYYTATLTTTDIHNCSSVDTQQVHIMGPTANFTADTLGGCAPITVTFKDSSQTEGGSIISWTWDYGLGGPTETTTIDSVSHVYNSSGLYSVSLTVTDVNGCTDTHTNLNFINPTKPEAGITLQDTLGCVNASELIIGNAGPPLTFALPVTYTWDFGDSQSSSSTSNQTTHNYSANGSYIITLNIEDANGCRDTIQSNIFINTTPASFTLSTSDTCVEIGGIKKVLIYANFQSTSNNLVTNWNWDLTVFNQPIWTSPNFFHAYNVPPGSYDATLIVTNSYGCTDTSIIPGAIVVPGPTGSFSFSPDSGCSPLTVSFTGTSTNSQLYAWDFGDGIVLNGTPDSIIQHTYNAVNTYTPQFYLGFLLSNSFCYIPVPNAGDVIVTSPISVDIVESRIVVLDGEKDTLTVNVTNGIPPLIYNWTPANQVINGPTSNTFLATIEKDSAYYYVSVPYGITGCSNFDSVLVVYIINDCELKLNPDSIPNVFTPDGNFQNDTYHIPNLCKYDNFKFKIFNRWGKLVYESTDPEFQWDGNTTSGTEAAEGVYYFILNTKTKQLHGYIELIRSED